jgi:hypothetical protein
MTTSWRDRSQTAPLWAWFLYFTIFGPLFAGSFWLADPDVTALGALFLMIFGGLGFSGLMTAWLAAVRRRDHDVLGDLTRSDRIEMARAARTGELPLDRALDRPMLALIERRRTQNRRSRVSLPFGGGAIALITAANALSTGSWWYWAHAAALTALVIAGTIQATRNVTKLDRLETAINIRIQESST